MFYFVTFDYSASKIVGPFILEREAFDAGFAWLDGCFGYYRGASFVVEKTMVEAEWRQAVHKAVA